MSTAVRLSDDIVSDAQKHAKLNMRTVPKQIEYWYLLGKAAEENPDLPLAFIKAAMQGKLEMELGNVSDFEFRKTK